MHAGRQKGKVCDACSRIYRICLSAPLLYSWQTKVAGTCRWGTPLCPCARFSFVSQSSHHCIPISHALPPLSTSQKMTLTQSLTTYSTPTAIQQPTLPSLPDFTSDIPSPHTPSHSCPPLPPSALLATAALFPPPPPVSQVCRGLVRGAPTTSLSPIASPAACLLRTLAETPPAGTCFPGNWQVISIGRSTGPLPQLPKSLPGSCVVCISVISRAKI